MQFIEITCPAPGCGVTFCITSGFRDHRKDDHKTFYCPNGHTNYFPQQTDTERYRAAWQQEIERRSRAEKELREVKQLREVKRKAKRANAKKQVNK